MILMIESQLNYMADYLRQLDVLGGRAALDARPSAVGAWNRRVQERMKRTVWNTGGCTSWYLDANGRNTTIWPGTTTEFRRATRRWTSGSTRSCGRRQADAPPRPSSPGRPSPRRSRDEPAAATRRYAPPVPARELTAVSADGARLHVEVHGPRRRARRGARARLDLLHRLLGRADPGPRRRPPGRSPTTSADTGARPPSAPRRTAPTRSPTTWRRCSRATLAPGREGRARRALHGRHDADGRLAAGRASGSTRRPYCCAARAVRGWSPSRSSCRCGPGGCGPG